MGKASRIKQQSAREKIAAQREAARKAERRNRMLITGGSTIVVLVVVLAFIIVKLSQGKLPFTPGSGAPLTSGGKPEMLYIGAEYCPYCAAMRWSMAVALSRFGT